METHVLHHIRPMKDGARSHLMSCDDGHLYVVKFADSTKRYRELASAYLATQLGVWAGLPMPECSVVHVPQLVIDNTADLSIHNSLRHKYPSGPHLGCRLVGSPAPGPLYDSIPDSYVTSLSNVTRFAGVLALDKWCSSIGPRQAVFYRPGGDKQYEAHFVNQSRSFGGSAWSFHAERHHGLFDRRVVYRSIVGWSSFEPFLSRFLTIKPDTVWAIAQGIPSGWYEDENQLLERLIEGLLQRRGRLHDLIAQLRSAELSLFPDWSKETHVYVKHQWGRATPSLDPG